MRSRSFFSLSSRSLISPSPSARTRQSGCQAIRTSLAFVSPSRVLAVSKVSRSPTLILSGSIRALFRSLICKNVSGPPPSTAINPKPRSAFHIFSLPVLLLFPFFQPDLDRTADHPLDQLGAKASVLDFGD